MKLKLILSLFFIGNLLLGAAVARKPVAVDDPNLIMLTESNHVLLRGGVDDESISKVTAALTEQINARGKLTYPIYLVLDTPGGSVDAGFRLYEFLHNYSNIKTLTLASYSMGAVLVEMLPGDRLMIETGVLMFHRMAVAFPKHHNMDQIDARLKFFHAQEDMVIHKIAARTGVELPKLQKMIDEDLFMNAQQALDQNFIDRIVSVKCSSGLLQKKIEETVSGMGLIPDMTIEKSACPLL